MKPAVIELKVLDLLEALRYISELEAKEKGVEYVVGCSKYTDGSLSYHKRMWSQVCDDQHGNQQFSNDSFYRFTTLGLVDIGEYGEATEEVKLLLKHFPDSVNDSDSYDPYILFDVSW